MRIFTLARSLGETDTTIQVEQNPIHSTMAPNRKVLKIGTELISYEGYTTTPPYTFHDCVRGIDRTTVNAQPTGYMFGLLDVSEFGATSVYLDQYSDLQDEVADGIAELWDAGLEFIHFDGLEGVNPPFWYHVAGAQYRVFAKLTPEPIFAEGAAKTHFSWHMLTGGNAFDVFRPEKLKEETIRHPFVAGGSRDVIAYTFQRQEAFYAVYWHISGDGELELPLEPADLVVLESLEEGIGASSGARRDTSVVPLGKRRYLKTSKSRKDELMAAFGDARILDA